MNKFCVAISHAICISPNGAISPCCSSQVLNIENNENIVDVLNGKTFKKIRKQHNLGEIPNICKWCYATEASGLISRRGLMNNATRDYYEENLKEKKLKSYTHMDISFGNTCNQKCVMCNSQFSSKWLSEDVQLLNNKNFEKLEYTLDRTQKGLGSPAITLGNWTISQDQLDQLISLVDEHTSIVEFKGGEPFLDKRFIPFVQRIIEKNANTKIVITSNGSIISDELISFLNTIKRIDLGISIDGTGDTYNLIRDYDFKKVEKNFHRLVEKLDKRHWLFLTYTTLKYNIDHFRRMYDWTGSISKLYNRRIPMVFAQVVRNPKALHLGYADKQKIIEGIEQLKYIREDPADFADWPLYKDRIDEQIKYIQQHIDLYEIFNQNLDMQKKYEKWFLSTRTEI